MNARDELARFWAKVDKSGECWEWTANKTPDGYGRFWSAGKLVRAYRYAYEISKGSIPCDLHIDHLCRNRGCVNPSHLEAVTNDENARRGINSYALRSTCRKGKHDITHPESWYVRPNGARTCRGCRRDSSGVQNERRRKPASVLYEPEGK